MKVTDKNETLKPPEGFEPISVSAKGAFILLEYKKEQSNEKTILHMTIFIYLNDQGREVVRTEEFWTETIPVSEPPKPPRTFWQRFWDKILFLTGGE